MEREVLVELAKARAKVRDDIAAISKKIFAHFVKILANPKHIAVGHWREEVSIWLAEISTQRCKPDNKLLKEKDYYDYLFGNFADSEQEFGEKVDTWIDTGDIPADLKPNEKDYPRLYKIMKGFYKDYAVRTASEEIVRSREGITTILKILY